MEDKKIREAVEESLKDPRWREVYEAAPSDVSRMHIELEFYYSFHDGRFAPRLSGAENREIFADMYRLEDKMSAKDWDYLYAHTPAGTYRRICLYRKELVETGVLDYVKWRYIWNYMSRKNPFRAHAKAKMDEFAALATDPARREMNEWEEDRMEDALSRHAKDHRWKRLYDGCTSVAQRRIMELCTYFAEYHDMGHFIGELIGYRYGTDTSAWEYIEDTVTDYLEISVKDMLESVRL